MAKYNGLKLKIEAIGLTIAKIENGTFYASYFIQSPIGGQISKLNTNIGSYVDAQTELLEIINPDLLQVKLSVFAKDLIDLKKGQSVRFQSANTQDVHTATISAIGVAIDNESKSIACYALMTNKKPTHPLANDFIEAEIITNTDTVTALPSSAIIKHENSYFILLLNKQEKGKYVFNKMEVKTGRQHEGYTEIIQTKIDGLILTHGIYNISL
jgi:cobalt-zinc-cadmium efflux system membrane fusion protein